MITVYSKNNCPACSNAKQTLTINDIEFKTINVDENFEAFNFIIGEGHRTFPQLYNEDGSLFVVGGYAGLKKKFEVEGLKTI